MRGIETAFFIVKLKSFKPFFIHKNLRVWKTLYIFHVFSLFLSNEKQFKIEVQNFLFSIELIKVLKNWVLRLILAWHEHLETLIIILLTEKRFIIKADAFID